MKSLQVRETNNFNKRAHNLRDFSQINAQIAISTLKHRMAVQKVLNMINERIQDPPTLAELASFSGLSRTYLSYIFKEVTGMRLQDYLIQVRLNKAKELLSQIDLKVKQIAYEVGFTDPNYFCRAFKKKMGLNPTNWRLREILSDKNYHPLEERFRMGSM
jgi:two-component system response regulator YesN